MKKARLLVALTLAFSSLAFADDTPAVDIWKGKCTGCHGDDGKAQTKMGKKEKIPDFSTADWQSDMKDADIRQVIAEGSKDNAKMKAFKEKLSASEIDALVKYIRTFKAK